MALELKIVSGHAELVGDDSVREFSEDGGTIGRSLHSDWILPDPDRFISSSHASIDFKGGIYYLLDTSSNGVYVNDEVEPIGNGNPRRLFNGDHLRMGDFKFVVSVDSGESLVMPLDAEPEFVPDNDIQLVDEVSLRTGIKLLDEDEITGDDEFQSALFGSGPKPVARVAGPKTAQKSATDASEPLKKAAPGGGVEVTAEDLFDSFLDGLGISRLDLEPSVSRPDMMQTAGQVLRESISGLAKLLASRADMKGAFRLDQTIAMPRQNNPIKLSENTTDILTHLLTGSEGEYLGARDAIREVSRDLIDHQSALLDAMNSAFLQFAERFDPEELQDGFDRSIGSSKLFGFLNSRKYWQMYSDLYPIITEKGSGHFPQMFGEEFVNEYKRKIAGFRRDSRGDAVRKGTPGIAVDSDDPGLGDTQKLVSSNDSESAFEDGDVVRALTTSGALEIDQSLVDELDNSISQEIAQDQLKA